MIPNELSYWAGMIDGDGYIGMMQINKDKRPTISLGLTDEKTVVDFAAAFNLTCVKRTSPSQISGLAKGHKQQWYSRGVCHKAYLVVKQIQPWLMVKKEAAKEICAYYEGRVCQNCGKDISPDRAYGAIFCCTKCYKQASNRKRQGSFTPIIDSREIIIPERKFSMEEEKLNYFAGLCDAEGHFSAATIERGGTRTVFQLKMISEESIKEFADFFEVPYKKLQAPSHISDQKVLGHSQAYTIHVDGKTTYKITKKLQPYLRLKKDQADLIVFFHER